MEDFASAAMMRLIDLGLARLGLSPPQGGGAAAAHVPLGDKRARADGLLERLGPTVLLRLAEAIDDAPDEPVLVALLSARDPADLIARWQRLERFVHSRHRTRVLGADGRHMRLQHVALSPHPAPRRSEDLLVFGLLAALFRRLGAVGLTLRLPEDDSSRYENGAWRERPYPADLSTWEFAWREITAHEPAAALTGPVDDLAAATRDRFDADPGRRWTVQAVAADMNTSARSLQRQLNARGTSFSRLLGDARLTAAARLLTASPASVAETGYACGFADQAHFTRAFRQHTGITPARYKTQFARPG